MAAAAAACAAAAAVVFCLVRRRSAVVSPLLLFAALGYLSLQPWAHPRFSPEHVSRFVDTGVWEITGVVDSRPQGFESRTRFFLRVEELRREQETRRVSGLLRVTVMGEDPGLAHGDRVGLRSRIRPIRSYANPGGYDFKRAMADLGVWAGAFVDGARLVRLEKPAGRGFMSAVDTARSRIARAIDRTVGMPEAAVLKALVVGDRSGVSPAVREAFTRTGTGHILAISGLHIGIVASVAFFAFRWLLGWIPALLEGGGGRRIAALLTLAPTAAYALIGGFSPSTQRALVMVGVFLLALQIERETDLMNTLAVAAFGVLLAHPPALYSVSFQLSFTAVFAIVYGLEAWRRRPAADPAPSAAAGKTGRFGRGFVLFLLVSFFATWGTLPLTALYFNLVSLVGLLANCFVVPLVGYLVVPLGLAAAALTPLFEPAAQALFRISGFFLTWSIQLVELIAAQPFAAVRTVTPSVLEILLFYAASGAVLALIRGRSAPPEAPLTPVGRNSGPRRRVTVRRKAAVAVLCASVLAGCADAGYWLHQRYWREDLRVTWIDVGQGQAVLLELPRGYTMLVDGGGVADNAAFDVGAAVVAPVLWHHKIRTVDTLVLSHPNSDHANGLVFIAENFNVGALWSNGESNASQGYQALMRAAAERGIKRPRFEDLERPTVVNGVALEILYPPAGFLARRALERWRNENNNSLVLKVGLGAVSVLLPGDVMRQAERELARIAGDRLRSTVLTVPHHGSRDSSSEEFLSAVAPGTVVFSCADRGEFGLPHPLVLERYRDRGARIFRTDQDGAVRLTTDGRRLVVETQRASAKASR
jgi:competence protein ComEC